MHKCPAKVISSATTVHRSNCNCCDSCQALCNEMAKQKLSDYLKEFLDHNSVTGKIKRKLREWCRVDD